MSAEDTIVIEPPPSLPEVLARFEMSDEVRAALTEALYDREEELAGLLALAGSGYQLMPEVVAHVLMHLRLGRPKSEAEQEHIHAQYRALIQRLNNEQGG